MQTVYNKVNETTQTAEQLSPMAYEVCQVNTDTDVVQNLLPIIPIKIKRLNLNFLIDSGSSISLINRLTFEDIKHEINYKLLGRKIQIKTINSIVSFSACVELTFKVNKNFFKQTFYVTDFNADNFQAILGFDFLCKNNVNLNISDQCIDINKEKIHFVTTKCPSEKGTNATMVAMECVKAPFDKNSEIVSDNLQNLEIQSNPSTSYGQNCTICKHLAQCTTYQLTNPTASTCELPCTVPKVPNLAEIQLETQSLNSESIAARQELVSQKQSPSVNTPIEIGRAHV